MKNKILALLATIGLASSVSAVEINDNISINGFIDGSYQTYNQTSGDTEQLGLDEVEIDFLFNSGSGAVHVDTDGSSNVWTDTNNDGVQDAGETGNAGDQLFNIEQAHFTYSLDNGVSFTLVVTVLHLVLSVKIQLVFTLLASVQQYDGQITILVMLTQQRLKVLQLHMLVMLSHLQLPSKKTTKMFKT